MNEYIDIEYIQNTYNKLHDWERYEITFMSIDEICDIMQISPDNAIYLKVLCNE